MTASKKTSHRLKRRPRGHHVVLHRQNAQGIPAKIQAQTERKANEDEDAEIPLHSGKLVLGHSSNRFTVLPSTEPAPGVAGKRFLPPQSAFTFRSTKHLTPKVRSRSPAVVNKPPESRKIRVVLPPPPMATPMAKEPPSMTPLGGIRPKQRRAREMDHAMASPVMPTVARPPSSRTRTVPSTFPKPSPPTIATSNSNSIDHPRSSIQHSTITSPTELHYQPASSSAGDRKVESRSQSTSYVPRIQLPPSPPETPTLPAERSGSPSGNPPSDLETHHKETPHSVIIIFLPPDPSPPRAETIVPAPASKEPPPPVCSATKQEPTASIYSKESGDEEVTNVAAMRDADEESGYGSCEDEGYMSDPYEDVNEYWEEKESKEREGWEWIE